MRIIAVFLITFFFTAPILYADAVIMKDGRRLKGLVVEEYVDRVVLNTVDGEKNIFRKDLERIEYDTPEQNFMQLGRAYDAEGRYDKAVVYYKKAIEVNPGYKEAKDAYLVSHAKIWRQEERMTRKELERQSMIMEWRENRNKKDLTVERDKALSLKNILGISLLEKDGIFMMSEIKPHSSANRAGIQTGDILISIWGRPVRYNKIEKVINELLGPKHSEVKMVVEKEITVRIDASDKDFYKDLGILLGFEYEGLAIKDVVSEKKGEKAGFKKGDFVIAIDRNITRYLPFDSVITLINSPKENENINFTVRRTINLRRGDE